MCEGETMDHASKMVKTKQTEASSESEFKVRMMTERQQWAAFVNKTIVCLINFSRNLTDLVQEVE